MNAHHAHCQRLRSALLDLHRQLVELERREYEKWHGRQSAGDFLQVLAYGDELRWLEPLSRLIVMLDEALDGKADAALTPAAVVQRAKALLRLDREASEDYAQRYAKHFDQSPELAVAHTAVLAVLRTSA